LYAKGDVGFCVNDVRVESGWLAACKELTYWSYKRREKKRRTSVYFFYVLHHDEKKEKEMCVCVCVERENFCRRRSRVRERAKGNRCDVMKAVVLQR